jgi:hypothetical protein
LENELNNEKGGRRGKRGLREEEEGRRIVMIVEKTQS